MQSQITALKFDNKVILAETKILFPEIKNIAIANHAFTENKESKKVVTVILYESKNDLNSSEKQKLILWIKSKFKSDAVEIYKRE